MIDIIKKAPELREELKKLRKDWKLNKNNDKILSDIENKAKEVQLTLEVVELFKGKAIYNG